MGDAIGNGLLYVTGVGEEHSVEPVLSAISVSGLGMDYQLALQQALTGVSSSPPQSPPPNSEGNTGGSTGSQDGDSSSSGGGDLPPHLNPCAIAPRSLGANLLASIKCTAHDLTLYAECGFGIAQLLYLPLKGLKLVVAAKSVDVIDKLPERLRSVAKVIYDLAHYKYSKYAPAGFRTGAEAIDTLKKLRFAYQMIELLPDIAKAISKVDYSQFALDLDKVLGLKACVQAVAEGLAG